MKTEKKKVRVGKLIRKTPGGRHGWFESNVGIVKNQSNSFFKRGNKKIKIKLKTHERNIKYTRGKRSYIFFT